MEKGSVLNDPEVKGALKLLKDKGVTLNEIELWLHVASAAIPQKQKEEDIA